MAMLRRFMAMLFLTLLPVDYASRDHDFGEMLMAGQEKEEMISKGGANSTGGSSGVIAGMVNGFGPGECNTMPDGRKPLRLQGVLAFSREDAYEGQLAAWSGLVDTTNVLEQAGLLPFPVDTTFWTKAVQQKAANQAAQQRERDSASLTSFDAMTPYMKGFVEDGSALAGAALADAIGLIRQARAQLATKIAEDDRARMRMLFAAGGMQSNLGGAFAAFLEATFKHEYLAVPLQRPHFRFNYPDVTNQAKGKPNRMFHADACGFINVFFGNAMDGQDAVKVKPKGKVLGCSQQNMPFASFFGELARILLSFEQGRLQDLGLSSFAGKLGAVVRALRGKHIWEDDELVRNAVESAWGTNFASLADVTGIHPWIDDHAHMYNIHFMTVEDSDQALAVMPIRDAPFPDPAVVLNPCDTGAPKLVSTAVLEATVLENEMDAWVFHTLGKAVDRGDDDPGRPEEFAAFHTAVDVLKQGARVPRQPRESVEHRVILLKNDVLKSFLECLLPADERPSGKCSDFK